MPILEGNALHITEARLGFPALIQPKASVPNATPKYSAVFILEPDSPVWGEMKQIVQAMATAKWGDNAGNVMAAIKGDKRLRCYGEGNEKISTKTSKVFDGFVDQLFISASNSDQPKLVGANAQELPPTANANQLFVGGNIVSAVVSFWLQDNQFGKGIRANLDAVQYLREGEHFGSGGPDTSNVFTPAATTPAAAVDTADFL